VVEAFILDFDRDIYGLDLTIEFVQFLRPELAFEAVGPLVEQMTDDVEVTKGILEGVRSEI
jgi:riboflavin kinase/FMN adenylyltransferase